MCQPLTAYLRIGSCSTSLQVWDEQGGYDRLNVMPDSPYDGTERQRVAAFHAEADRMLSEGGWVRAAEWAPAYQTAVWDWSTTLRATRTPQCREGRCGNCWVDEGECTCRCHPLLAQLVED